ncbi:glycosyltransferase [Ensifer sp. ENS09]|nr:glycosyltransferase [Ensifer sp. ENS09]
MYYLERLASCLNPCKERIEWIVVDDSPNSAVIQIFMERIKGAFPNVKLIRHSENRGIRSAYVSGFTQASGKYVGILDHDDEVNLAPLLDCLLGCGDEIDLLYTDERKFSSAIIESYHKPSFDILSAVQYFYPHHITLFRTEVAKQILLASDTSINLATTTFDIAFWYEYLFFFRENGLRVRHVAQELYGWRIHPGSTAASIEQKPSHIKERKSIAEHFFDRFESNYTVDARADISYVIKGEFGENFDSACEYIGHYFYIDFVHTNGGIVSPHYEVVALSPISLRRLRNVPFAVLATYERHAQLIIPSAPALESGRSHPEGVAFLKDWDPRTRLEFRTYLRLISKQANAKTASRLIVRELCL